MEAVRDCGHGQSDGALDRDIFPGIRRRDSTLCKVPDNVEQGGKRKFAAAEMHQVGRIGNSHSIQIAPRLLEGLCNS